MSNLLRHPYHLVDESPWPLLASMAAFFLTMGMVVWFHKGNPSTFYLALISLILISLQWWRDISAESSFQGHHSGIVELGLRLGMILFIISEIFFFLSFFWGYFHMGLAISIDLGNFWCPLGIKMVDPLSMPLLNTIILLTSGISITWSHHAILEKNHSEASRSLVLTISLGFLFTLLQALEYFELAFSMADSVFGSLFYIATGFHGIHVIIGSIFLTVSWLRLYKGYFSDSHHFGFEASAWYWHFVDVVWLFLYLTIYWWSWLWAH